MARTREESKQMILAYWKDLDDIDAEAVLAVVNAMTGGARGAAAYAAGNEILVAAGREPVPYPAKQTAQ